MYKRYVTLKTSGSIFFFHPDCTVGSGFTPDQPSAMQSITDRSRTAAGDPAFTASRELHPTPKKHPYISSSTDHTPDPYICQVKRNPALTQRGDLDFAQKGNPALAQRGDLDFAQKENPALAQKSKPESCILREISI